MHSSIRIGFLLPFLLLFLPAIGFAQMRPAALLPLDSLDFPAMQQKVGELLGTVQFVAASQQAKAAELDAMQQAALHQWEAAKMDSTQSKQQIDSLGLLAKSAVRKHKTAYNSNIKTDKIKQQLEGMLQNDSLTLRKNLPGVWKQVTQWYDKEFPPAVEAPIEKETMPVDTVKTDKPKPSRPSAAPLKKLAVYKPAADVMLTPPARPCLVASSSRDEFSGEISRQLAPAELFRYTNPALKAYLQGKTHVVCEAALASNGPNAVLHLTFIINDPNARKAFGRLEKNSLATLKFMDGSSFELQNAVADDGIFNPETDGSIFHAQYPLSAELLKKIRRTELDKIRVLWSKGYDDYDVQQVGLLMRQAECLFPK